jgi:hypothetical protein
VIVEGALIAKKKKFNVPNVRSMKNSMFLGRQGFAEFDLPVLRQDPILVAVVLL